MALQLLDVIQITEDTATVTAAPTQIHKLGVLGSSQLPQSD